ncbi:MAG TPA: hypothetical protein VHS03_06460 [Gaiellaceae bacterium]|jgi:hypothetical protein|nr:hypothetical protein [Gaiellaceae bacterium]
MASLSELEERRAFECRLTPDRALETLGDAVAFIADRGLLTRTTDCSLPGLHEACHEPAYKPGAGGFGSWPATKWWWGFEVARHPEVVAAKIHRGKTLFLDAPTAALVDPVCRGEIARMEREDEGRASLLRHLGNAGPSLVEDLLRELEVTPKELKSIRAPLERCGAIVSRFFKVDEDWVTELARWDHVVPKSQTGGLDELVVAGVRAAVVCPEREPKRWFSWRWLWDDGLIDRLVADDRLVRPEPGWLATG